MQVWGRTDCENRTCSIELILNTHWLVLSLLPGNPEQHSGEHDQSGFFLSIFHFFLYNTFAFQVIHISICDHFTFITDFTCSRIDGQFSFLFLSFFFQINQSSPSWEIIQKLVSSKSTKPRLRTELWQHLAFNFDGSP